MNKVINFIFICIICFCLYYLGSNYYNDYIKDNNSSNINQSINDVLSRYTSSKDEVTENNTDELEDSHITGSDIEVDTVKCYYYNLLNTKQQSLYKQVYANLINFKTTFIPVIEVYEDDVPDVMSAVFDDHPELFYIETSYSYRYYEDGKIAQIIMKFNDLVNNYNTVKNNIDSVVNEIVNNANTYSTDYDKELYVHDTLVSMINYDTSSSYNQSIYSALILNNSVCAGYARSFQYIMNLLDIPTYYIEGSASIEHAWDIVLLSNRYYNVDLTWDDSEYKYLYFNVTDEYMSKTHERTGLSVYLPHCVGGMYSNNVSEYDYNYYYNSNIHIDSELEYDIS